MKVWNEQLSDMQYMENGQNNNEQKFLYIISISDRTVFALCYIE